MLEIGISIWFFIRLSLLVNEAPGCERRSLADFQSACQSGRAVSFAYQPMVGSDVAGVWPYLLRPVHAEAAGIKVQVGS